MTSGSFKKLKSSTNYSFTNPIYLIDMYKQDWALNKLQEFICRKNQPTNQQPFIYIYIYIYI